MDNVEAETELVELAEAGRRLGCKPEALRKRIQRGTLQAVKIDGLWHITLPRLLSPPDAPPPEPGPPLLEAVAATPALAPGIDGVGLAIAGQVVLQRLSEQGSELAHLQEDYAVLQDEHQYLRSQYDRLMLALREQTANMQEAQHLVQRALSLGRGEQPEPPWHGSIEPVPPSASWSFLRRIRAWLSGR
jgi:hypothetical protein